MAFWGSVRWLIAGAAAGLMPACQRGTLDGPTAPAMLGADGGVVSAGGGVSGPPAGSGVGVAGGSDGGQAPPVVAACAPPSLASQAWTEVIAQSDLAGFQITDAWAVPGSDDLFFGAMLPPTGDPPISATRIVRWTRGCWSTEVSWSARSALAPSVAGAARDDVWATVGDALLHRDAIGWSRADDELRAMLDDRHPGAVPAFGAVRVGASGVWSMGGAFIWQRDRRVGWRMFEPSADEIIGPGHSSYDSFWFTALSVDDAGAAIGGAIDISGSIPDAAFVYRYDGSAWSRRGISQGRISALQSDGAGGLWIGTASGGWNPPLFHLGGTTANGVSQGEQVEIDGWPAATEAQSLWSGGANDVWAAAGCYLAHWDGASWTAVAAPPVAGSGVTILAGDTASIWFVTAGPRFFRLGR
jgi:hypothetical protein